MTIIKISTKIAFLSFGGGNAIMGMIYSECVEKYKICTPEDFNRLFSLTNILPGPLSINTLTVLSYQFGGFFVALVGFLILLLPGPLLALVSSTILTHYMSPETLLKISISVIPVIIALLLEFIIKSYKTHKKTVYSFNFYIILFFISLLLLILNVHIAFILLSSIALLYIIALLNKDTIK